MARVLLVRHGETDWNREGRVQGWAPTSLSDRGREQARALATALSEPTPDAGTATGQRAVGDGAADAETTVGAPGGAVAAGSRPIVDSAGSTTDGLAPDLTVDRLVTSDLRRARETAAAVERATGCRPISEADWRERDMGRLQGLPARELFERHPHLSLKDAGKAAADRAPEGGETLLETRDRVLGAWDRLRADLRPDETAVVVSHSGPISLLLGHVCDVPITEAVLERPQDNGAINEVHVDGGVGDDDSDGRGHDGAGEHARDDDATGVRLVRENWTAYRARAAEN